MTEEPSQPPKHTHEISESKSDPFDPKTMRKTEPGLKRLLLTLSVLFSFLLGLPFLYNSVKIYRSPLPFRDIETLSSRIESHPLSFPCHFRAFLVGFDWDSVNPDRVKSAIVSKMAERMSRTPQCGSCGDNFSVSVVIESGSSCVGSGSGEGFGYECGELSGVGFGSEEDEDEGVDEKLWYVLGERGYSVVVVNAVEAERAVVGKYRHGWVVGRIEEVDEAVERVVEVFVKVFVNGGEEEGGLVQSEFMPVGSDGRVVFSFNLLNADPRDWIFDWDFQRIDETWLAPMIKALGPLANISVESQVLYHTPKSSFSYWDKNRNCYILTTKDLPFFVNSNEWNLDTSAAAGGRSKILHFVVYVPSAKECPLNLQLPNGEISETNGFISPMWGGIIVWNPQGCLKDIKARQNLRHILSPQDMQKVIEIFIGQIRQLFGLKSNSFSVGKSGIITHLPSEKGFTEWELDLLSRKHTCFNLHSTASTLGSLSRLVQSLPRMIIIDEIGRQVKFSLEAAKVAESNVSLGMQDASAVSSRQARSLAEDAFFHPSIMSVSYFSFEHCFAVYSPFFLPVSLHVVLAAIREWRRYKQEKSKYLNWKAKVKIE